MKLEIRRPRAPKAPGVPGMEPKLFSIRHRTTDDVARRIISISKNADQARSIAELMK
jgi:hypothetical protein